MSEEKHKALGYEVIVVSPFEVGLVKNFACGHSEGVKTWWCSDFDRKLPGLDHPLIVEAIEANEVFLKELHERRKA